MAQHTLYHGDHPRDTFETMRDDEIAHWRDDYASRLVTLADDIATGYPAMTPEELATYSTPWRAALLQYGRTRAVSAEELRASTGAFYRHLLAAGDAEIARRARTRHRRTATADLPQFPPDWLLDLKRQVNLDGLFEHEAGLHLGQLSAARQRSGPCPFCGGAADSTRFRVYLADPDREHFHCFACGQSGDAITAIALLYRVPFRDACLILATHAGLALPTSMRPPEPPARPIVPDYLALDDQR